MLVWHAPVLLCDQYDVQYRVCTVQQSNDLISTYAGAAEPLALGQDGKPVLDMHTQVTEERVCEGPLDFVTRYHQFMIWSICLLLMLNVNRKSEHLT